MAAIFHYNPDRPFRDSPELYLCYWGKEACAPQHSFGPGVRDVYKIHFVHEGKGIVRVEDGETLTLTAGQAFIAYPERVVFYQADAARPWVYSWIAFCGDQAGEILARTRVTAEQPVFPMDTRLMPKLYELLNEAEEQAATRDLRLRALLNEFFSVMVELAPASAQGQAAVQAQAKDAYIHRCLDFLHSHYGEEISVGQLAAVVGLDRKYLSAIFNNRAGRSGLKLPAISLGLWHNFGGIDVLENGRAMLRRAFDLGITHFDLANNYGPPPGSAEETFGRVLREDLRPYRDEMIISTKAGYYMWPGPYGEWGSKKYLVSSLDQSLKRMGLEYVDIFYHHRPDPDTPLEETMSALDLVVRQGKALYVGLSNYRPEETRAAAKILKELGTPCVIHQPSYSMMNRWIEEGLQDVLQEEGIGSIVFSPLEKGILTDRYLGGIAPDSRAAGPSVFLRAEDLTGERIGQVKRLNDLAAARGQKLSQMALSWVLRGGKVTSALIGASKVSQIEDAVVALRNTSFSAEELGKIDEILGY